MTERMKERFRMHSMPSRKLETVKSAVEFSIDVTTVEIKIESRIRVESHVRSHTRARSIYRAFTSRERAVCMKHPRKRARDARNFCNCTRRRTLANLSAISAIVFRTFPDTYGDLDRNSPRTQARILDDRR